MEYINDDDDWKSLIRAKSVYTSNPEPPRVLFIDESLFWIRKVTVGLVFISH